MLGAYFILLNVRIEVFYKIEQYKVNQKLPTSGLFCKDATQYDACDNYVGSVYIGGYGGLSERGLHGHREIAL